jgi:hypothetical protein
VEHVGEGGGRDAEGDVDEMITDDGYVVTDQSLWGRIQTIWLVLWMFRHSTLFKMSWRKFLWTAPQYIVRGRYKIDLT